MKILLTSLIVLLAFTIQSMTGFGGVLIAMPLALGVIGLESSRCVLNAVSWVTAMIVTMTHLKEIDYKKLAVILVLMFAGILLGQKIENYVPQTPLYIAYGAAIIFIALWNMFANKGVHREQPLVIRAGLLLLAGIFHGIFVSGGGFLLIYAQSAFRDKKKFRATSCAVWSVLNIYLIVTQVAGGAFTKENILMTLICILPGLLAVYISEKLVKKVDQKKFMLITDLLVLCTGVIMIFNAI